MAAIDVFALGLLFAALALYVFRSDAVLTAIPIVLALPVFLLQPWFVAFLWWQPGYSPLLTAATTICVYYFLDRLRLLEWAKRTIARFRPHAWAWAGRVAVVILVVALTRYMDILAVDEGVPGSTTRRADFAAVKTTDSRYYMLESFFDTQWLWQAR